MSVLVVAHIEVKDEEGFNHYAENGLKIVASVGGEVVTSGSFARALAGEHDRSTFVLIRFPDHEAVDKWYYSDEYQALIPGRNKSADISFLAFDEG